MIYSGFREIFNEILGFFGNFSRISADFLPHPKPPISQQVALACRWLSGVL